MFKPHGNPKIVELTLSTKNRSRNLDTLRAIERDGKRVCAWCNASALKSKQQKYCSADCSISAWAWFYPQKEWGLGILMIRQEWLCKVCGFSWRALAQEIHNKQYRMRRVVENHLWIYKEDPTLKEPFALGEKVDWALMKRIKRQSPGARKPEVDHIIPIFKGGTSIGLDNHQVICNACHKLKTAADFKK